MGGTGSIPKANSIAIAIPIATPNPNPIPIPAGDIENTPVPQASGLTAQDFSTQSSDSIADFISDHSKGLANA